MLRYKKASKSECSNTFWPNTLAKTLPFAFKFYYITSVSIC